MKAIKKVISFEWWTISFAKVLKCNKSISRWSIITCRAKVWIVRPKMNLPRTQLNHVHHKNEKLLQTNSSGKVQRILYESRQ